MHVLVIGGANMDYKARLQKDARLKECNPGRVDAFYGGVGRNIAENLGRLHVPTAFFGVCGEDAHGRALEGHLKRLGIAVYGPKSEKSSVFMAVVENDGDMMIGVSDMEGMKKITPESLRRYDKDIRKAEALVLECNLPEDALHHIFETYGEKTFYVDGVSAAKVPKIRPYLSRIHTLKLTERETHELCGDIGDLNDKVSWCLKQGVQRVFVSMGERGFLYQSHEGTRFVKALNVNVSETSGAGDALMAGIVYADFHQIDPVPYALAASALAVQSDSTVNPKMSPEALEKILKEYDYDRFRHS